MSDQKFPKRRRLTRQNEFDRVYQRGLFAADEVLVIKGIANGLDHSRIGLSVSRKVGNAVVRNRWKRRIREAFRNHQSEIPAGFDLVVRPRKGAACDYHAIANSLPSLTRRLARKCKHAGPSLLAEEPRS